MVKIRRSVALAAISAQLVRSRPTIRSTTWTARPTSRLIVADADEASWSLPIAVYLSDYP